MCGRFVAASDPEGLMRLFMVDERIPRDWAPSWNVAPTASVLAVVEHERRRLLVGFRWGLVPAWAENPKAGSRMINARAETLTERPAYREAFTRRRCLIPADGFYEWQRLDDGTRQPFLLGAPDGQPLALAGLWATWRPPDGGEPLRTCTIVTTPATADLADLHDRMPLVLPADRWEPWLDRSLRDPARLDGLLAPPPPGLLARQPVGLAVNDVRNDSPRLVAPLLG